MTDSQTVNALISAIQRIKLRGEEPNEVYIIGSPVYCHVPGMKNPEPKQDPKRKTPFYRGLKKYKKEWN